MAEEVAEQLIRYLEANELMLTTAESCTAGEIVSLLSRVDGCGSVLECGYVVYSVQAKRRLLRVSQKTIDQFNLTSEEVACEMAEGALCDSEAHVSIATTGVAGPDAVDGVSPGTICFAWSFKRQDGSLRTFMATERFSGDRQQVQYLASRFAIERLSHYHAQMSQEN